MIASPAFYCALLAWVEGVGRADDPRVAGVELPHEDGVEHGLVQDLVELRRGEARDARGLEELLVRRARAQVDVRPLEVRAHADVVHVPPEKARRADFNDQNTLKYNEST